jgi:hypothetical protein
MNAKNLSIPIRQQPLLNEGPGPGDGPEMPGLARPGDRIRKGAHRHG